MSQTDPLRPFGRSGGDATAASGWSATGGPGTPVAARRFQPEWRTRAMLAAIVVLVLFSGLMTILYLVALDDVEHYRELWYDC